MSYLPDGGARPTKPYGVCVHTTGDGLASKVYKGDPADALKVARTVYEGMGTVGPHVVIAPSGAFEVYATPDRVRHHVGIEAEHRRSFLDGHWKEDANRIGREVVSWWEARWQGVRSPSHLYPSKKPNLDYIGIELIPCGTYGRSGWTWKAGCKPGFDSQRFSVEQYFTLAETIREYATEFDIDLDKPGRLVGHEDINPYTRPGWDPGDARKWFSWSMVNGLLRRL